MQASVLWLAVAVVVMARWRRVARRRGITTPRWAAPARDAALVLVPLAAAAFVLVAMRRPI